MASRLAQFLDIKVGESVHQQVLMPESCHTNALGTVHEGVLTALMAEAACSAMGRDGKAVLSGISLQFPSLAKPEDGWIVADAVEVTVDGTVTIVVHQGEDLIATGTMRF